MPTITHTQRGLILLRRSSTLNKCGNYNVVPAFSSKIFSSNIHSVSQLSKKETQYNTIPSETLATHCSSITPSLQTFLSDGQLLPRLSVLRHQKLHNSSRVDIFKTFSSNESKASESELKQDSTNAASDNTENAESTSDCKDQVERLTAEITDMKTKNEDILDKYRRSIAENDNMRKRLTKQIEDAKIYGIQGFCKDLLEVADVLQKAVEAAKVEDEKLGSSLAGGIELTQTQMHQVFSRHGLSQISPCVGETKFDPNMHEALFQVPVPDKDPNIIMDVQQIGYSLHGRTIRPAKVGVSRK